MSYVVNIAYSGSVCVTNLVEEPVWGEMVIKYKFCEFDIMSIFND